MTLEIAPFDRDDFEQLKKLGLNDSQASEVFFYCAKASISVSHAILLASAIGQAAQAIASVPSDHGIFAPSLHPHPIGLKEEHRLRSMRKPTGKPWDK